MYLAGQYGAGAATEALNALEGTVNQAGKTYVVKRGDTLSQISQKTGIPLSKLLEMNPHLRGRENYIEVGEGINLDPETIPDWAKREATAGEKAMSQRIGQEWEKRQQAESPWQKIAPQIPGTKEWMGRSSILNAAIPISGKNNILTVGFVKGGFLPEDTEKNVFEYMYLNNIPFGEIDPSINQKRFSRGTPVWQPDSNFQCNEVVDFILGIFGNSKEKRSIHDSAWQTRHIILVPDGAFDKALRIFGKTTLRKLAMEDAWEYPEVWQGGEGERYYNILAGIQLAQSLANAIFDEFRDAKNNLQMALIIQQNKSDAENWRAIIFSRYDEGMLKDLSLTYKYKYGLVDYERANKMRDNYFRYIDAKQK
ncbi:MAG: LysM peptidoglycan-binding domain-containing protein, partial [Brevinematales bacterium]|nr:LysM peptidoglycan-binding domain-containing protein [Brevinematales bacterium]